jgi:hypothetical protein
VASSPNAAQRNPGRISQIPLRSIQATLVSWGRSRAGLVRAYTKIITFPARTTTAAPLTRWATPAASSASSASSPATATLARRETSDCSRSSSCPASGSPGTQKCACGEGGCICYPACYLTIASRRHNIRSRAKPRSPAVSAVQPCRFVDRYFGSKSRHVHLNHLPLVKLDSPVVVR